MSYFDRYPNKPMVEPEDFTKKKYVVTEENGEEKTLTFSQLCANFGLRYHAVYSRVRYKGFTVEQAIKYCIKDPYCWGATYNNKYNVAGMPKQFHKDGSPVLLGETGDE